MSKQLIVNADDFGLSRGVNRGIMKAHLQGIVSSASIMVTMPGFQDAVQWAKSVPSLGIGFHFNLSYGKPLSPAHEVPSLVDEDGNFHKMKLSNPPHWEKDDVEKELILQWAQVKTSGIAITHLDSHHYIQRIPTVYPAYSQLAQEEGLPMRQTFQFEQGYNYEEYEPIHSEKHTLPKDHPYTTDTFIGDIYFRNKSVENLSEHLTHLKKGVTEINCHPGYVDDELKKLSAWTSYREMELKTLIHPNLKQVLQQNQIELITFKDLATSCLSG